MAHKPVIIVQQRKGGVGKSIVSRVVGEVMLDWSGRAESLAPAFVDADFDNGLLERHLQGCQPVRLMASLHAEAGWAELVRTIQTIPGDRPVLVDTPANCGEAFARYGSQLRQLITTMGRRHVRVFVLDQSIDTVAALADEFRERPADGDVVAILNGMWGGTPEAYGYWHRRVVGPGREEGGKVRQQLLEAGGAEVYLPKLMPDAMLAASKVHDRFEAAADALIARSELWYAASIQAWLSDCRAALAPLRERLGY